MTENLYELNNNYHKDCPCFYCPKEFFFNIGDVLVPNKSCHGTNDKGEILILAKVRMKSDVPENCKRYWFSQAVATRSVTADSLRRYTDQIVEVADDFEDRPNLNGWGENSIRKLYRKKSDDEEGQETKASQ